MSYIKLIIKNLNYKSTQVLSFCKFIIAIALGA